MFEHKESVDEIQAICQVFPVSYALWFSSSIAVMNRLVILWVNVIILWIKDNPYKQQTNLSCLSIFLCWTLWLSVTICHVQFFMFNTKLICLNSIGFPYWID